MWKRLSLSELEKLTTKRLLAYYKKSYKRERKLQAAQYCGCCGSPLWETNAGRFTDVVNKKREEEFHKTLSDSEDHLKLVKEILNGREHVDRK